MRPYWGEQRLEGKAGGTSLNKTCWTRMFLTDEILASKMHIIRDKIIPVCDNLCVVQSGWYGLIMVWKYNSEHPGSSIKDETAIYYQVGQWYSWRTISNTRCNFSVSWCVCVFLCVCVCPHVCVNKTYMREGNVVHYVISWTVCAWRWMALWEAGMSDRHLIWNPAVLYPSLHLSTCPPDINCGSHISSGLERKRRNRSTTSLISSFSGLRETGSFYWQWRCCFLCQSIVTAEKLQPKLPKATAQM